MSIDQWSTTAANNASGVTNVNWAEGQAPSTVNDSARNLMADVAGWYGQAKQNLALTSVAGTNTITATGAAALAAYATNQIFTLVPANTNTGATTLNITPSGGAALGAKNVFANGAACAGGELVQNVPVIVLYDGTQFNIIGYQPVVATQAQQEAGSSTTTMVTPGRQQYHPSAAKAWAKYTDTTVAASYNVSSVTSNGAGDKNVNFTTSFSSTSYCAIASASQTYVGVGTPTYCTIVSLATGSVRVATGTRDAGAAAGSNDVTFVACFGDQ